jgi:hypothetical protein
MPDRPAFLEIEGYILRRDVASTFRQGGFFIRAEVKDKSLGGAEGLAVPAIHATQNVFFRHVWKMRLISRIDDM